MLLLPSEDVHTWNYESFPFHPRSLSSTLYFTGHFAAALMKEKPTESRYLPRYVTDDGVVFEHSNCKSIVIVVALTVNWQLRGGLIFKVKCIFKNKPPPHSGPCLLL